MENLVMRENLASYYKGKKIFVTGHTGFKGAWLVACLNQFGGKVKGYALEPEYEEGLYNVLKPLDLCESVIADIRDRGRLTDEIRSFQPDFLFHLAAQALVRRSYQMPAETFEVNVAGTANVLEVLRSLEKKCTAVVVTTDKVYQNKEQDILFQESDSLGGYDPYSASKACAELVVTSFRNSFFEPAKYGKHQKAVASARAGNVIGGGDWSTDRIIPDIIQSLQCAEPVNVRNPLAVRPWQHVLEPINGYLSLAARLDHSPAEYSTAYNFGPLPEGHATVRELVEKAIRCWGNGSWKDVSDPSQPHEAGSLKLDISRASSQLGWRPKMDVDSAIEWTVGWYKQPAEKRANFTLQQIRQYFAL